MSDNDLTLEAQTDTPVETPMAFVEQRPVYHYPDDQRPLGTRNNSRRFSRGKREVLEGKTTTVRIGLCPHHNRRSMDFVGVDELGWLFHCKTDNNFVPSHYFHNRPAE